MCKQSLKAFLNAFVLQLFFRILFVDIFWLPVCECLSALSQLNVWLSVSTVRGCFFTWNFTCNLTSWLELLFSQIHNSITVWCFALCFFLRRDCVHKSFNFNIHLRLQKTSETSKSFENNILSRAIGLVKVFNAILTCMQTCEKLQCLYEKQMSSNFHKTAVLKKISIYCKLKLQSKGLS